MDDPYPKLCRTSSAVQQQRSGGPDGQGDCGDIAARERDSLRRELEAKAEDDARKQSRAEAIVRVLSGGIWLAGALIVALGIVVGANVGGDKVIKASEVGGDKVVETARNHHLHHHFLINWPWSFAKKERAELT